MRNEYDHEKYKLTCVDFGYTGVECCDTCHSAEFAEFELRVVKIDGINALLCCQMIRFFYPDEPDRGISPEEKLLRAIFGEKTVHFPTPRTKN